MWTVLFVYGSVGHLQATSTCPENAQYIPQKSVNSFCACNTPLRCRRHCTFSGHIPRRQLDGLISTVRAFRLSFSQCVCGACFSSPFDTAKRRRILGVMHSLSPQSQIGPFIGQSSLQIVLACTLFLSGLDRLSFFYKMKVQSVEVVMRALSRARPRSCVYIT